MMARSAPVPASRSRASSALPPPGSRVSASRAARRCTSSIDAGARGRSRAGRAARRRGCGRSVGSRSAIERSLSTCSWSCTTAMRHLGMVEHIGHLVGDASRHRPAPGSRRAIAPPPSPSRAAGGCCRRSRPCRRASSAERLQPRREGAHRSRAPPPRSRLCQMPRSLCRNAGRAPRSRALRRSNFGKVSGWPALALATMLVSTLCDRRTLRQPSFGPLSASHCMQILQPRMSFARGGLTDKAPFGRYCPAEVRRTRCALMGRWLALVADQSIEIEDRHAAMAELDHPEIGEFRQALISDLARHAGEQAKLLL